MIWLNRNLKNGRKSKSAEDVCKAFLERMDFLLKNLKLDTDGLRKVKAAYSENNIPLAFEKLPVVIQFPAALTIIRNRPE